jgi:predicted small metal-binding protein
MGRVINCECGETIRAESEDDLVGQVTAHVERDHPELVGKLTHDDILAMSAEE